MCGIYLHIAAAAVELKGEAASVGEAQGQRVAWRVLLLQANAQFAPHTIAAGHNRRVPGLLHLPRGLDSRGAVGVIVGRGLLVGDIGGIVHP